ncbi:MAG: hypothetical protein PVH03_07065 [Chloroflexota bacterium]|jgi:hypothetical protein
MGWLRRNQSLFIGLWLSLFLLLVGVFSLRSTRNLQAAPQNQEGNLIQNPGFEGNFSGWSGIPEVQVASNWTPWWWDNPGHDPPYFRPEYKRALASVFPKRVLSGSSSQQWFTFHASHLAGMYQQVSNVTPNQRYRFTIFAQVWSSIEDEPNTSVLPANPHMQIGIDPTGNWDPGSPEIIWSPEASMASVVDQWGMLSVEATAMNDVVTVFMRTNPEFANKHNDMYWDQASLELIGPPEPTPLPPTNTPGPPTNTPEATNTSVATNTPIATNTSPPTNTPLPSPTPTSESEPTATAEPSETSTPTASPVPATDTATPESTDTAEPTSTPANTEVAALPPTVTEASSQEADDVTAEDSPSTFSAVLLVAIGLLIILLVIVLVVVLRRGSQS